MAAAKRKKPISRQEFCRQLIGLLKKRYPPDAVQNERTVLETLLYGICLEDASHEQADAAFERLSTDFHDLNEIRVSSIRELEPVFDKMEQPEWRALRVRSVLQHVFESSYTFEYESLLRRTLKQATRQLQRVAYLTRFARDFVLQNALGGHVIPLDNVQRNALAWLGVVPVKLSIPRSIKQLKSLVRKPDAVLFGVLLRRLGTDPLIRRAFDVHGNPLPEGGYPLETAVDRLNELYKEAESQRRKRRKAARKAGVAKKPAAAKKTASKSKGKTRRTAAAKSTGSKRTPASGRKASRSRKS